MKKLVLPLAAAILLPCAVWVHSASAGKASANNLCWHHNERRLEALGAKPLRESASSVADQGSASQATTGPTRQPVLCNSERKILCFSSPEARAMYLEAFADWERSRFDAEAKSKGLPSGIRSAYLAGLAKAKRGEKPAVR